MKLVSTTLTANSEGLIEGALLSVLPWVDVCLVIEKRFTWTDDFSQARNFALHAAFEVGGKWAVTLDTDERIHLNGELIHEQLRAAQVGVFMVKHEDETYAKERFFRLPMSVAWKGPTHESFAAYEVGSETLTRARFSELPKSQQAARAKFERDARVLAAYASEHPGDPRWHYYLGESLKNLERHEEAIVAYERCASLRGWNEESAWACYRAAECMCRLHRFREAVDLCAAGLARHAGLSELAWLAGYAAYQMGDAEQAIYWARLSLAGGYFEGTGRTVPRIGFRNPAALYEGPYDVLRFALRQVGDDLGAIQADEKYEMARKARDAASASQPSASQSQPSASQKGRPAL